MNPISVPVPAYSFGTDKADLKKETSALFNIAVICCFVAQNSESVLEAIVLVDFKTECSSGSSLMRQTCQEFGASF